MRQKGHRNFLADRVLLVALCAATVCLLPNGAKLRAQAPAWETFQGNSSHTGYVPVSLDAARFSTAWTRTDSYRSDYYDEPVAAGRGLVYGAVSSYNGFELLTAYDAITGTVAWSKSIIASTILNGSSPPAVKNGVVYWTVSGASGSSPTGMYAYDALTGTQIFRTPVGTQLGEYGAPQPYSGKVYSDLAYAGGLQAIDGLTGSINWSAPVPQQHGWTPAADAQHVYLYLGEASASPGPGTGTFYAYNRSTGALDYRISDANSTGANYETDTRMGNPLLGSQNDAFAINNGRLIRFDFNNRSVSWELAADFSAGLALKNEQLFGVANGQLQVMDELTGNALWSWQPPVGRLFSNVIVTDTHAFVSGFVMDARYNYFPTTYAIDLASHVAVWSIPNGGDLALADNSLFIQSYDFYNQKTVFTAVSLGIPEPRTSVLVGIFALCSLRFRVMPPFDRA
jgi:hypothetical protein